MNAQPARTIKVAEIPSLLGLEGAACGRFTLWQRHAGHYTEPDPGKEALRDDPDLHEALARWVGRSGILGPTARRPARETTHPTLALTGRPDALIDDGSRFAEGRGIALIQAVETWEWRAIGLWRDDDGKPTPPPHAQAMAQALLLLYEQARWCLLVPVIGWRRHAVKAPLRVDRSPELCDRLRAAIDDFQTSLETREPPAPDARADLACLATLTRESAAQARATPVRIEGAAAKRIDKAVDEARESAARLNEHRTQGAELWAQHANTMQRLRTALGRTPSVDTGRVQISLHVDHKTPQPTEDPRLSAHIVAGGQYERLQFTRPSTRSGEDTPR